MNTSNKTILFVTFLLFTIVQQSNAQFFCHTISHKSNSDASRSVAPCSLKDYIYQDPTINCDGNGFTTIDCNHASYMKTSYGKVRIPLQFHYSDDLYIHDNALAYYLSNVNKIFSHNGVKLEFYNAGNKIDTETVYCDYSPTCGSCDHSPKDDLSDACFDFPEYIHVGIFSKLEIAEDSNPGNPNDPCLIINYNGNCIYQETDFSGFTAYPTTVGSAPDNMIVIDSDKIPYSPYVLAHELGHIFGLYHTFECFAFNDISGSCFGDGITDTQADFTYDNTVGTNNVMDYNIDDLIFFNYDITSCQRTKMYDHLFLCGNREILGLQAEAPIIQYHQGCGSSFEYVSNTASNPYPLTSGCHKLSADIITNGLNKHSNTGQLVNWELYNVTNGNQFIQDVYKNYVSFNTDDLTVGNIYKFKVFETPPYNYFNFGIPTEFYFVYNNTGSACDLDFNSFDVDFYDSNGDGYTDEATYSCQGISGTTYRIDHYDSNDNFIAFTYDNDVGVTYGPWGNFGNGHKICITEENNSQCDNYKCIINNYYFGSAPLCQDLSTFTHTISGEEVLYDWDWPSSTLSIHIEESADGVQIDDTHIINSTNDSDISISQGTCEQFYVRAKVFCGSGFSSYTSWEFVDMGASNSACNSTSCSNPSNLSHNINGSNTQVTISYNNSDQEPHTVCLIENGVEDCEYVPFYNSGYTFNISTCENYSYKVKKLCGSEESNWSYGESFVPGNSCNSLSDLYPQMSSPYMTYTNNVLKVNNLTIKNNGSYDMGPPIEIGIYLTEFYNNEVTTNDILIFTIIRNTFIPAGGTKTYNEGISADFLSFVPNGTYKVGAIVDYQNKLPESIETNNVWSSTDVQNAIIGCTDPTATNYNPNANLDVGRCFYCDDGIKNGLEVGIDCGGPDCGPCCYDVYYEDNDNDGYGHPYNSIVACPQPTSGYVTNNNDCNDNDADVYPFAPELCDGKDNDCDGLTDEDLITFFEDQDGDGYGDATSSITDCDQPSGYVLNNLDCDDSDDTVYPDAPEICDGLDNDCNGQTDEIGTLTFYQDSDNDGYGNPTVTTQACALPSGYVTDNTDCDDTNANVNPGASDICDGIDNNCNTIIDENGNFIFYQDLDGDGYGNSAITSVGCVAPTGYVTNGLDCNDNNAFISPGSIEVCDGLDNNCDGIIDPSNCNGWICENATLINASGSYYADGPNGGNGATLTSADHGDWFRYIPAQDGFITIASCLENVDTRLLVYEGFCGNLNPLFDTEYQYDDICEMSPGGNPFASLAQVEVSCGKSYYILWDNRWSDEDFNFTCYFFPDEGTCFATETSLFNGYESAESYDVIATDSFGDGWNGGSLEVQVSNGPTMSFTLATGAGPDIIGSFDAHAGDIVNLSFCDGGFDYESNWQIIDSSGDILHEGNGGNYDGDDNDCDPVSAIVIYEEFNEWRQVKCDDDLDWIMWSGFTPSSAINHVTGPDQALVGDGYLYVESSGTGYPNKTAIIESPCFDLSSYNEPTLNFFRHMYGSDMGSLTLQISTDNGISWQLLTPFWSGDYGNLWHYNSVDLKAYKNQSIQLRFTATTGSGWRSDIALDHIYISESCPDVRNFTVTQTYNAHWEANDVIYSTALIAANEAKYDAKNSIELNPGFEVLLGADFHAYIDGCGFTNVSVIGPAISGWTVDVNLSEFSPDSYELLNFYLNAGEMKFRANNNWTNNWSSSDFPSGIGTLNGANIVIPMAGYYNIEFNSYSGEYNFVFLGP